VPADHLLILHEATSAEHHALARAHELLAALQLGHDAHHAAVVLDDQPLAAGTGLQHDARARGCLHEDLHQELARGDAILLHVVTTRRRLRDLAEGVGAFASRKGEALAQLRHGGHVVGDAVLVEGHTPLREPMEVLHAAVTEETDLRLVGARPTGRHEVSRHLVRVVVEATCLLERRAAPQVELPGGLRRGPTPAPAALERQGLGAGFRGFGGRTDPGSAKAHDDDIGLAVPARDITRTARGAGSARFHQRFSPNLSDPPVSAAPA
jgi:hypothetical protein